MTKTAMTFYDGEKKACMVSRLLHKIKKREYKGDIIELKYMNSFENELRGFRCTPKEALIIADALIHTVVCFNNRKRKQYGTANKSNH